MLFKFGKLLVIRVVLKKYYFLSWFLFIGFVGLFFEDFYFFIKKVVVVRKYFEKYRKVGNFCFLYYVKV